MMERSANDTRIVFKQGSLSVLNFDLDWLVARDCRVRRKLKQLYRFASDLRCWAELRVAENAIDRLNVRKEAVPFNRTLGTRAT